MALSRPHYNNHLTKEMRLNLTRPLIIFDLETTGLDLAKDRIIQISYIKVEIDGTEKPVNLFVNPQQPIPALVQQLTSITDDMVKDAPTFKQIASQLEAEFKDVTSPDSTPTSLMSLCLPRNSCAQV